ncbi:retrovirus-related Pol polyprotein from transposon 412 [Trichonephila clavipes]|nr:retrovirus-related Pol polyprotein from transposon 412 [Trichonephila clavipes]
MSCRMVVDTGANVSIMRKDLAQNSQVNIIWTPPSVSLQTVTNDKIQVHRKADITLRFGNIDYHHTAYIADITDPCILGLKFLKNNNFKLDFENSNMHSKFEDITLFVLQTQFESNQRINAKTNISLLPRTECIIPGLVAENRKFRFGVIDYPDPGSLKAGVLIALSVVDLSNSVIQVRIANISDRTRTIQEGEEELQNLIKDIKNNDVIEPSSSSLASPTVWVRKKDDSTRFCEDYHRLNDVTKKDSYHLPRIDDTLDTLAGNTWFPTLDLKSGRVFQKLKEANLKLSPSKCHLFRREVTYLGHIISAEGVRTDPGKISAVKDWNCPTDVHQLRSFLGLCTYYRKFVKNFSTIARPLLKLTEAKPKFIWVVDCNNAFNKLKDALTSAAILAYPGKQFILLDTDASHESIGAVLSQEIDCHERVIAYFSKCMSKPERNFCVTRKELLAIVKAVEHFHPYLYGRRSLLRTDHASLTWLLNFKNSEGQIARWMHRLHENDVEIRHRKGSAHGNADALSRRPCPESCKYCSRIEKKFGVKDPIVRQVTAPSTSAMDPWSDESVRNDQLADPEIKPIIEFFLLANRSAVQEATCLLPINDALLT